MCRTSYRQSKSIYGLQIILKKLFFSHMKKCIQDDHALLMTYCLLLWITLWCSHVISSGAKKNITLRIFPLYIFFRLHNVALKQNKQTEKKMVH